jgi:deoxyguanosine kinase
LTAILASILDFRYIAIEGPIGAGKTALAQHLGARLSSAVVLDDTDNPFIGDLYSGRPGAAFQSQLFSVLTRHRQQASLRQTDLFSQLTICDYLFDKDKIYAYLNLDDNELFIYQRLYNLLAADVMAPDLVVYLQAPTHVLCQRARAHRRSDSDVLFPDDNYLKELNEAYTHFFYHYNATPLLIVETSQLDLEWGDEDLDELIKQVRDMGHSTRYYVPRTGKV